MGKKEQTAGLMKAGELAKAAGVSVSTVKFYAKEGLIRASLKTGRNMAYYDPAHPEAAAGAVLPPVCHQGAAGKRRRRKGGI